MLSNIMFAKNMVYGNLRFKEVNGKTYVEGDSGDSILLESGEEYLFIKNIINNGPVIYKADFNKRVENIEDRFLCDDESLSCSIKGMLAICEI